MLDFFRSIRQPGFTKAPASPAAASKSRFAPHPRIKPQSAPYAPANHMQAQTMFALTDSPLTRSDLTTAQTDAMDSAYRSSSVQNAAASVRFKLLKLVEATALRSEMNRAIAGMDPDAVAPDAVVAVLRQRVTELEDLIEAAKEDHARHDAASKACASRRAPLRNAASNRLSALQVEFDGLVREAESLRRTLPSFANAEQTRQMLLQQAGVSAEEMAAMRAAAAAAPANKEERRAQVQARTAEIKTAMEPLRKFGETGDESLLADMPEFEALIAARRAAEANLNF